MADPVTTEVGLYNLALSLIGSTVSVASTTEASKEAETCLLWYAEARNRVLAAAPWPSALGTARLELDVERETSEDWTDAAPLPGWAYSYVLPTDILRPRYISNYSRFQLYNDVNGQNRLATDWEDPVLVYTKLVDIDKWDHLLKMAVVHALSAYIVMPLTGKLQRAGVVIQQANDMILEARTTNANQEEQQLESMPDWITARGYGGYAPQTRYVYPNGPLLTATAAATV